MARFRIVYGNKVPTDHLIDVENVPKSFLANLELQPKANWIHPNKPEYMMEYKANQWEDLQTMIAKHNKDMRVPEPICVVQTDDADRARILPPNIKDSDIPVIVLQLEPEPEKPVTQIKASFVCPSCDFEGKAQDDIEGHLKEKHGEDPAVRSLAGKPVIKTEEPKLVQMMYACASCDYQTPIKSDLVTHTKTHSSPAPVSVAVCGVDGCEFRDENPMKMRGHRMGAHRKRAVAA